MSDTCPEIVHRRDRSASSWKCGRPIKRDGLCGTHAARRRVEEALALLGIPGNPYLDPDKIKDEHYCRPEFGDRHCRCCGEPWPCEKVQLADALARTHEWGEAYFNEAQALRAQLAAVRIRDTQAERHQQL